MNLKEFDDNNAAQQPRGKDPLFYTKIVLDDSAILPPGEVKDVPLDDYLPPPRGKSEPQDFDLLSHLEIKEQGEGEEEDVVDDEAEEADLFVQKYRKVVPNIQDFWIKLVPNDDQFISVILKTFSEGLQQIKCFERWSKHADLLLYSEALETWDDKVGEDFGESSLESTSLDPVSWISEHPIQKNREQEVKDVIKSAYAKAKQFMTRFQPILEIYWRNLQFDINVLVDVNLVNAVESLQNTLNLLKYYQAYFQSNLPSNCDIGLLHLDSLKIKNELQPKPR
jgi:hypothetical protein